MLARVIADHAVRRAVRNGTFHAELYHHMWIELLIQSLAGMQRTIGFQLRLPQHAWRCDDMQQMQAGVKHHCQIAGSLNRRIAERAEIAGDKDTLDAEHG
jgi:hypothetical protein